jgi:hypothetical protein
MMENYERCKVCDVAFKTGDKVMWCKVKTCPETEQREMSEQQYRWIMHKKAALRQFDA